VEAAEDLIEGQAVEEPIASGDSQAVQEPRRLPEQTRRGEVEAGRGEVRTAAIAAAGGLVAGAATVAAVRAARSGTRRGSRGLLPRRKADRPIIASRSFLIDVHVLGR
jgi:hypothetical protein